MVNKMSKLTVGAGPIPPQFSDDASCSVDECDQTTRAMDADRFVKQVFESTDKVDRRILQLFKVRHKLLTINEKPTEVKKKHANKKVPKSPISVDYEQSHSSLVS